MAKTRVPVAKRDKDLLKVLIFILIAFVVYYFGMGPAIARSTMLSEDALAAEAEYNQAAEVVRKLPELKQEEKKLISILSEKYQQFFYEINEERLLMKLDKIIADSGLPMSTITISKLYADAISTETADYSPVSYPLMDLAAKSNKSLIIDDGKGVQKDNQNSKSKEIPKDAVAYSDFQITFSAGTYESAYSFIKSVEELDRTIIVKNVNLKKGKNGAGLDGEILLGIYSIAKPNELDSTDLEFKPVQPKGKTNPFS